MVDNYVEDIRNFIVENKLITFYDVKGMELAPTRLNLIMQSRLKPSEEFINYKSSLFTKAVQQEDGYYMVVITGIKLEETLDEIKKALLIF